MFEHLKKLEVKGKTAKYELYMLEGRPKLIVKPATEANKPYFNEVLRRSAKSVRRAAMGRISVTTDDIVKNREDDRKLFPKFVITGWEDVVDSDGKLVEFNESNCSEFLQALPDWIFDDIAIYCRNNSNFVETTLDDDEVDELAKN